MAFGLIFLVVLLLILGGLITGIVLWSTSGRSGGSTEMSCNACGYAVRGLTQLNCPECGVDLREAGISRGSSPGRRVAGMVLTIGCSSVLLLGCGLSMFTFLSSGSSPQSGTPAIAPPAATQQTPNTSGGTSSSPPGNTPSESGDDSSEDPPSESTP